MVANLREQQSTAGGIVSTKLNHVLEVSDIDDDDSSVDAAGLEEEEESDNDDSSGNRGAPAVPRTRRTAMRTCLRPIGIFRTGRTRTTT